MADLARQRSELERAGTWVALVQMSDVDDFGKLAAADGLVDFPQVSDLDRLLYRAFGLRRGDLSQLIGRRILVRGFQAAILARHGLGPIRGASTQMLGVFLIRNGRIIATHRHRNSADRPEYAAMRSLGA
jgi:hypothetical protein